MKNLALYSLAAALYVAGGAFMKYSDGLTKVFPRLRSSASLPRLRCCKPGR